VDNDQPQQTITTVCRMFSGPHLVHDFRQLSALGSGTLLIDLIAGTCRHDRRPVPRLVVVDRLRSWLKRSLSTAPSSAEMAVTLQLDEHEGQQHKGVYWAGGAKVFIGCAITVKGKLVVDDAVYESEYGCQLEWPRDLSL